VKIAELFGRPDPVFSFEFFIPKTPGETDAFLANVRALQALKPAFVTLTYGAGGSARERTIELAGRMRNEVGTETVCHLTGITHTRAEMSRNLERLRAAGVTFRHGDVRCAEDWQDLKADFVVNAAAQPSAIDGYANPTLDVNVNTMGVLQALEFCRREDAGIVQFSTNKVYPVHAVNDRPIIQSTHRYECSEPVGEDCPLDGGDRSIYGVSKVMADLMIQEWADAFQMPAIINRCSCLAGPWQWGKCE